MSLKNILAKTEEYLRVPAVVRFEQPLMRHLVKDFSGYDVKEYDRLLVVSRKGLKSTKIVTVHIDRHGIVVNEEGNFEFAAFNTKKYYETEEDVKEAKPEEWFFKECGRRFVGEEVYAYDDLGKILGEGKVKSFSYDLGKRDLLFEIEGLEGLRGGRVVAYKPELVVREGRITSQLDNVVGVAVARQLMEDGYDGRVIFSTEEEGWRSGEYICSYLLNEGISSREIITLDVVPCDESAVRGGYLVLREGDSRGEYNLGLVKKLRSACEKEGIKHLVRKEVESSASSGGTELGLIVSHSGGNFNGATIQLPVTGYHTNHETTSELALENYYGALLKLLSF